MQRKGTTSKALVRAWRELDINEQFLEKLAEEVRVDLNGRAK
jgi:hypothetical protein